MNEIAKTRENKNNMPLGEKIERIRGNKTSFAFAKEIGAEWEDLCRFEIGTKLPSPEILSKIAQIGGTTIEELLSGEYVSIK